MLIDKCKGVSRKNCNDSKDFIVYWNDMGDISESIEEYNPHKGHKILIVIDDMIADMLYNKKL